MFRRVTVIAACIALFAAALAPVSRAQDPAPPEVPDHLRAFSISPPGQSGHITLDELVTGNFGPHFEDQLEMYASLVNDFVVADDELEDYFHSMQFGPQGEIERTYSPTDGVTVFRDAEFGIPHIYADSLEASSFALGYVTAEDRLFEAEVFRRAANGELAELLGPDFLEMDIATRREGYTDEEVQEQFDALDDKFGASGAAVQAGLQAYVDGINEYINELRLNMFDCPAAYNVTDNPCPEPHPETWTVADTLQLVVLQLRVFGETAGGELENAGLFAHLEKRLGEELGPQVFDDLLRHNDSRSPTSIAPVDGRFPAQRLGPTKPASFVIPDDAEELARDQGRREAEQSRILASLGLSAPASNALLVSGRKSKTGNPLHIGAPQVGYAVPSFFMDIDVHVAGNDPVDFMGPAVPGASALIPLGRGRDYAWSLTTGVSDAVDVRVEELCDPEGEEPTEESNAYMFEGECIEMTSRDETFIVKPSVASPGAPGIEEHTFYRTAHGPVFARGTVDGKPVAFVKERFFFTRELDSIPPFYEWNTQVHSVEDFKAAAERFTMSFNAFYADATDIGHFHVGFYPERTEGVHPSLPIWGTGEWEWEGRLPFNRQPQVINPSSGWLVNWNNKPAKRWANFDGYKWGAITRVSHLQESMHELLDGSGKAELSDLVNVIRDAATRDTRGVYLGPEMVERASPQVEEDSREAQALQIVSDWIAAGAHRRNINADDEMDSGAALSIFDQWYDVLVHKVFDDELGEDGFELIGMSVSSYNPAGGSSFFHDFSSVLANVFDPTASEAYARNYCDNRETDERESCGQVVMDALVQALTEIAEEQGQDMSLWTKEAENIEFSPLDVGSVPDIPWQNRGTHNHVVEILSDAE
ncbi:MAG: penicillin acylase family protein [Actinomycetota bacterium]